MSKLRHLTFSKFLATKSFVLGLALTFVAISSENIFALEPVGKAKWTSSYQDALKKSKKTGQPVMLVFSGSDWCHWCKRLSNEVFETPTFATWSTNKVIPIEIDFPQSHSLPAIIAKQNKRLASKFRAHVKSYPTVLFIDSDEQVVGKIGYVNGGPQNWIAKAKLEVKSVNKFASVEIVRSK